MKNFGVKEFVSKQTYSLHGEKSIQLISNELIQFMDFFHDWCSDRFNSKCTIVINDWAWRNGGFEYRGLRDTGYYGSAEKFDKSRSRHKCGMCADFDVYVDGKRVHPATIRGFIIDHYMLPQFESVRFIESGVNWVHVSVEPTAGNQLIVWDVNTGESVIHDRRI